MNSVCMNSKNLVRLLCASLFLFLTACARNNQVPATTLGQLEEKLGAYQHAQIVQRGEFLRLILYKDRFFEPNSTKINQNRFRELTLIAQVIQATGDDRMILITGHTDSVKSERERLRESDIMARNIAAYLWAKGVPYQRMRVFGLSDKKLIAEEDSPFGSAYNRRVEILVPFDDAF